MTTVFQEWKQEMREQDLEEGRKEGRQEGMAKLTLLILQRRLGRISAGARKRIKSLSCEKLLELALVLGNFRTKKDLSDWLAKRDR
jgi:predicted transposase YdaD